MFPELFLICIVAWVPGALPPAQGEPVASEAIQEAMLREGFNLSEILRVHDKTLHELLEAADAALEKASTAREVNGVVSILTEIGSFDRPQAFSPGRVERVSRELTRQRSMKDVNRAAWEVARYLNQAIDRGYIWHMDVVKDRVKASFLSSPREMGCVLLRLAPDDPEVREFVRSASQSFGKGRRRYLLAAAGDADVLLELVGELRLDVPGLVDPDLPLSPYERAVETGHWDEEYTRAVVLANLRTGAIDVLGNARDCRVVGPLMEVILRKLPVPETRDFGYIPYSDMVRPAVRKILSSYPDIIPLERIPPEPVMVPGTEKHLMKQWEKRNDAWVQWWEKEGKDIPGLDIRKSREEIWKKGVGHVQVLPRD